MAASTTPSSPAWRNRSSSSAICVVLGWETESLLDECKRLADEEGLEGRASKVGEVLAKLDHAEAGLFIAALVARATKGVDKSEAELLKRIGKSAGLGPDAV